MQTCVVHLIRAPMRFVSYSDRKAVAAALKPMYTASNAKAARGEFDAFRDSTWGKKYPHAVATWDNAWERFTPFLAFPPQLRRVIYTTNSIESLNSGGLAVRAFGGAPSSKTRAEAKPTDPQQVNDPTS